MEQPKMHYWAEIGQQDGKYSAAIDYDRRQNGGVYVKGTVTAVGMKLWARLTALAAGSRLKKSGRFWKRCMESERAMIACLEGML
ncbi:hypothetical protein HYU17_01535 [Candidatus Woesearchaeota archaeon]|nr:hypothetical protein [Candidatus Woesearchaeota archaeon]